jgi:predicted phosphodiesterase
MQRGRKSQQRKTALFPLSAFPPSAILHSSFIILHFLPVLTRVISDVHYQDPASWIQELHQLEPLLNGVDVLIVNGDLLDTQILSDAAPTVAKIKSFLAARVPQVVYLTGNHDPDISNVHELSLAQDSIWITHGDVFFDDIAPWGRPVVELRRRIRALAGNLSREQFRQLETRFKIFRQVTLKLPREHDPEARHFFAKCLRIFRAVFPPTRVLTMMRVWREMPDIAARYADEQRPRAKIILTGHTHFHGVWKRGRHVIVNTGSLCAPREGQIVDITENALEVRRVVRRKGLFYPGKAVEKFSFASLSIPALSNIA